MKILFLAANPVDVVARLRIDHELREVSQKLHRVTHGQPLEMVSELAVRAGDLQAALLLHQPDIVHFSGHCSQTSGIVLEDDKGCSAIVSRRALADLFSLLKGNIRVVVLNACYAKDQAQALIGTLDCAIGMNDAISDKAALVFAAHFYQSLAFGCSVETAFRLARNQLDIEGLDGAQIPELLVREGADAALIRFVEPSTPNVETERPGADSAAPIVNLPTTPATEGSANHVKPYASVPVMRGISGAEIPGKNRRMALLVWLFFSLATLLTTDVLRRFLREESDWLNLIAVIVQMVFLVVATLAVVLIVASLLRPGTAVLEKVSPLKGLHKPSQDRQAALMTGSLLVLAFGVWLALPVMAHYYNERGFALQYGEPADLTRAREAYQQALRLQPHYAQAHYNLGSVQEDLQPEKAIEEYRQALHYDSLIYPAYNNLARLYLQRGKGNDYETAVNLLSQGVELSPPDENVQYALNKNLGWANFALKRYAVAENYLRRALSLRPPNRAAAAHCLLAYVLKEQGKAEAADQCFYCVTLAPGEKDVEAKWVSDAQECLLKGDRK
ncbi:MAG: tetratricopeptide repeat protein [Acidobacteria bacterium]|nr:tetratricopeptide repeat protein [Acidobacteriota bacterium]